jgi:hypothetical protein
MTAATMGEGKLALAGRLSAASRSSRPPRTSRREAAHRSSSLSDKIVVLKVIWALLELLTPGARRDVLGALVRSFVERPRRRSGARSKNRGAGRKPASR